MPDYPTPDEALARLLDRVEPVDCEVVSPQDAAELAGRVLAAPVTLDRDSPACDASAMDGFAARAADLAAGAPAQSTVDESTPIAGAGQGSGLPIVGVTLPGAAPEPLAPGTATRITTGAPVPPGADTVVRLERVVEADGRVRLADGVTWPAGGDLRRRGENAPAGAEVLSAGARLTAAAIAALASVAPPTISVRRRLRVAVLTTGDELAGYAERDLPPWRLRDANGPMLAARIGRDPLVTQVTCERVGDTLDATIAALATACESADAVVLTGGVSKGQHDWVPEAIRRVGAETVFHRIAARPGHPTLGAASGGVPILGLPGNPLSVLTTCRRFGVPTLERRAGAAPRESAAGLVTLNEWRGKPSPMAWWRPVWLRSPGLAELVAVRSSGDVAGPATSDGFVEAPPGADHPGPYAYYPWDA